MKSAQIVAIEPGSPAHHAGLQVGDEIVMVNGEVPNDVIAWQLLTSESQVPFKVKRHQQNLDLLVSKRDGQPLGAEVHAAIFDRVQTCDNHCEFCFIHQLPRGMRRSLYLKDDDYRLSFLYGNFTTLTRFTELDLERVINERLSPLYVSIHATDPQIRADILRNRRGAISLRWLRLLLDNEIEVHGQVVVCPGVNDGEVLEDTLAGVLERFSDLASICVVPLGVSKFNKEVRMRPHTVAEAARVIETVNDWQQVFLEVLGRRLVFAADEYYLLAKRPFPAAENYEGFMMHEDGVGMVRTLELEFHNATLEPTLPRSGFFAWVDGAPADGYRTPRSTAVYLGRRKNVASKTSPIGVLTGSMSVPVIKSLVSTLNRDDVRVIEVPNHYFGGNIGVSGLMVGEDIATVLAQEPATHRYLLPDVCLSRGVFLDNLTPADLPRAIEVVPTTGAALRQALEPCG